MVGALLIGALVTKTYAGPIRDEVRTGLGFAGRHVWTFAWHRAVLSAFLTEGGWRFWASLGMLALSVGMLELRAGSRCALVTFWFAHFSTLLVLAILVGLPLAFVDHPFGHSLLDVKGVGPSAGYYGCLGLLATTLARRSWRQAVVWLIVAILAAQLVLALRDSSGHLTAPQSTVAHLVAFALGFAVVAPCRRGWKGRMTPLPVESPHDQSGENRDSRGT